MKHQNMQRAPRKAATKAGAETVDDTAPSHPRVTAAALNPAQLFYQLPEAFGQMHPG